MNFLLLVAPLVLVFTAVVPGSVAHAQEEAEPRGASLSGTYITFGPGMSGRLNAEGLGYSLAAGRGFDVRGAMVTLGGDLNFQGDSLWLDAGLGARFFPIDEDLAPYIGGFFGLGAVKGGGNGLFGGALAAGFTAGADAGVQLFRTSDIHLELGASFRWLLAELQANQGLPWIGVLRVGVFF